MLFCFEFCFKGINWISILHSFWSDFEKLVSEKQYGFGRIANGEVGFSSEAD